MLVKRLALAADTATLFEFDEFASNAVIVKNETAGEILFCDGPFDAAAAAHIPAYSWQALNVRIHTDRLPAFSIKAAVSGAVEVDFGSNGAGTLIGPAFDAAGLIPHKLTLTEGEDTTLTTTLTRLHGQTLDLETPVPLLTGATVFTGDVILIVPTADAGSYAKLKINGVNYGRLEAAMSLVISGETTIETEAVALVAKTLTMTPGADTTLAAAQTRLVGMLTDLLAPAPVVTAGTVYVGDAIEFTAATTAGAGYHVTLTIDDELAELDESGKASITVADNVVAVSASVEDEAG